MKIETFTARLEGGKANNFTYSTDGNEGLISVWKYMGSFIMTWEECPAGSQFDESGYARDERLEFPSVEALIEYLLSQSLDPTAFTP